MLLLWPLLLSTRRTNVCVYSHFVWKCISRTVESGIEVSPGNRNNRHHETVRHGGGECKLFLAVIRTPPSRRSPRSIPSDYRETYKPLISRAIFLIFFPPLCLVFLFFHISFFIFYLSQARDDKRPIPLSPLTLRRTRRVENGSPFGPIVKCNNQIRGFLDGGRGWKGMKRLADYIIFAANMWYARVNYSISLANITPCISSN